MTTALSPKAYDKSVILFNSCVVNVFLKKILGKKFHVGNFMFEVTNSTMEISGGKFLEKLCLIVLF